MSVMHIDHKAENIASCRKRNAIGGAWFLIRIAFFSVTVPVLLGSCTSLYQSSEELITQQPISQFKTPDVVPLNRKLLDQLAEKLAGGMTAREAELEYEREGRIAFINCDEVYRKEFNRVYGSFWPHTKAGRAFDNCLYRLGWEPGTESTFKEALALAKSKVARKSAEETKITTAPQLTDVSIGEKVFENTWRSVVVIEGSKGQGSGVIVRPNIVATNCHVISEGSIVVYKASNRQAEKETAFPAIIRRSDYERDFCLLDVSGLWGVPANVRKYNSLKVGENVYALGAPNGLDLSLSSGLISQLRQESGNRFIQTDSAISPGSSGGGLFDREGNLIGITTVKIVGEGTEGIGFAIPADLALE